MRWHLIITDEKTFECAENILKRLGSDGISVFLTGRGVLLLKDERFLSLLKQVEKCVVCEYSMEKYGIESANFQVVIGGQFQNAELVALSDKTVCL
jgi:intracellular sulfur oxidation DsrE/DsrF family protein